MKSENEIYELIDLCFDRIKEGKQSFGSFEEGVKAELEWVLRFCIGYVRIPY